MIQPTSRAKDNLWIMFYREGTVVLSFKIFSFDGTLQQAAQRASQHCKVMSYRFQRIVPLHNDLDAEELNQLGGDRELQAAQQKAFSAGTTFSKEEIEAAKV